MEIAKIKAENKQYYFGKILFGNNECIEFSLSKLKKLLEFSTYNSETDIMVNQYQEFLENNVKDTDIIHDAYVGPTKYVSYYSVEAGFIFLKFMTMFGPVGIFGKRRRDNTFRIYSFTKISKIQLDFELDAETTVFIPNEEEDFKYVNGTFTYTSTVERESLAPLFCYCYLSSFDSIIKIADQCFENSMNFPPIVNFPITYSLKISPKRSLMEWFDDLIKTHASTWYDKYKHEKNLSENKTTN